MADDPSKPEIRRPSRKIVVTINVTPCGAHLAVTLDKTDTTLNHGLNHDSYQRRKG